MDGQHRPEHLRHLRPGSPGPAGGHDPGAVPRHQDRGLIYCSGCGVATLSIDYCDIGYLASEMACDVLVSGTDISTMGVQSAAVTKMYDESVFQQLGLTMPEDYSSIAAD